MVAIGLATWATLLLGVGVALNGVVAAVLFHPIALLQTAVGVLIAIAMKIQLGMIKDRERAWPTP